MSIIDRIPLDAIASLVAAPTPGTVPVAEAVVAIRTERDIATRHRKAASRFLRRQAPEIAQLHADAAQSAADRAEHLFLTSDPGKVGKLRRAAPALVEARAQATAARSALAAYAAAHPDDTTAPPPVAQATQVVVHRGSPEPSVRFNYRDQKGRIWHYEDLSWFAGWHISGMTEMHTWEGAQAEFPEAFPLVQLAARNSTEAAA